MLKLPVVSLNEAHAPPRAVLRATGGEAKKGVLALLPCCRWDSLRRAAEGLLAFVGENAEAHQNERDEKWWSCFLAESMDS